MVLLYNVPLSLNWTVYIRTFNNWFITKEAKVPSFVLSKLPRASYLDKRTANFSLQHFQPDGLNVVKGLIFPLLFSALIILFQENISLRCKRSCLRLVKKLTGEFMRVNELYVLMNTNSLIQKKNKDVVSLATLQQAISLLRVTESSTYKVNSLPKEKVGSSSSSAGLQLSMFSLNCRQSLNQFLNSKIPK